MLVHDTGYVKVVVAFSAFAVDATGKEAKQSRQKGKALESACQEEPSICFAAYFTWLASSHRMAARSNSVNEVTPNFSFARAQYA
jgi:hypothetical protein